MEELKLNPAFYDIKIIYRYPQEVFHEWINYKYMAIKDDKHVKIMFNRIHKMPQVNATELYVNSEPLVEVGAKEVQQTTTSLQFTALDDGCTIIGVYILLHQETHLGEEDEDEDHIANNGETLLSQETHLWEEDEDKDHNANNGENFDDIDEYEERIERGDFDRDVNNHEFAPNFEDENIVDCDKGDTDDDIDVQHVTNTTTTYTPHASSFYANTWENMVDPSCLQIPFVCTWEGGMNFCKGLTFTNKKAMKRALIIYARGGNSCSRVGFMSCRAMSIQLYRLTQTRPV